ncbi:MAG: hypothetical protein AAF808_19435, partial [Cyanobacteria bacterium P01_D01_bin.2]
MGSWTTFRIVSASFCAAGLSGYLGWLAIATLWVKESASGNFISTKEPLSRSFWTWERGKYAMP